MRQGAVLVALVFAAVGSAGCQSYASGVQLICESPKHCAPCKSKEGPAQLEALRAYIDDHLRNDEAIEALRSLASAPEGEQGEALRRIATEAGVAACPMAALMDGAASAAP